MEKILRPKANSIEPRISSTAAWVSRGRISQAGKNSV